MSVPKLKTPPHSAEAEARILGAVLRTPALYDDLADHVDVRDFYVRDYRVIWSAIAALNAESTQPDVIVVAERLGADLDPIGGLTYLTDLVIEAGATENLKDYAQIIWAKARDRDVITIATEAASAAYAGDSPVEERMAKASAAFALVDAPGASGLRPQRDWLSPVMLDLDNRHQNGGEIHGIPTGLSVLDQMTTGLSPGDLIILAARPAMGKSALAMQIASYASTASQQPVACFQFEMTGDQLTLRALAQKSSVDLQSLRTGKVDNADWPKITAALKILDQDDNQVYIDDSTDLTVEQIKIRARRLQQEFGLSLIVVDYLQLLRLGGGDRQDLRIGDATRALKNTAKDLGVPVIVLSQLNRGVEQRDNKRPRLSDLRDSGAIEQDADMIWFLYRGEIYTPGEEALRGKAELIVAKQRMGPIGTVYLDWEGRTTHFRPGIKPNYEPPAKKRKAEYERL